ncbi:MAG: ThuA domain-containing protein [Acidimicrobiales bacterium]|nr:ThuA domain-containing protein [Acidimicrobiales bacterium]
MWDGLAAADPRLAWQAVEGFEPADAAGADVIVFYDMPGIEFTRADPPAVYTAPSAAFIDGFRSLLDEGQPMVFLHHAIAGWPAWPEFAGLLGARFDYERSGYRHDVEQQITVADPQHPVCAGLPPKFRLTDEAYLFEVDEAAVTPLLRSDYDFVDTNFYSADRAIRGARDSRDGWSHPPGSNLVAWTKRAGNSPIVYLQPGDGPSAYENPNFRLLLANAISWVADA